MGKQIYSREDFARFAEESRNRERNQQAAPPTPIPATSDAPPIRRPKEQDLHQQASENLKIATLAATSRQILRPLIPLLSRGAFLTLQALHLSALAKLAYENKSEKATFVTLFCPQDAVMLATGVRSRTTMLKYRAELEALGLVRTAVQQSHSAPNGKDYRDGLLWIVKMHPERGGRPRFHLEDFKHKNRDMSHDLETGRTAYQMKNEHTHKVLKGDMQIKYILHWALSPLLGSTLPTVYVHSAPEVALETVLHLPFEPKNARRDALSAAAWASCQALGDDSLDFFRWLYVRLMRLHIQGHSYFQGVYGLIRRCQTDAAEGFARNAAALFVARLQSSDLWHKLQNAPPIGVF